MVPLCTRHHIDAFIWQPGETSLEHAATFSAMGYIQASKQKRKFLAVPHDSSYSTIVDTSRHVYLYRQPRPMEGAELRNRKSGMKVEDVAVPQVVTLDSNDKIVGVAATPSTLAVLTTNSLNQVEEFFSTGKDMLGRELIDKNHTKFAKCKGLMLIQLLEYRQEANTVKLDNFTHAKVSKYNGVNKFQDMVTGVPVFIPG